ncbi:molecular chaperone GrpE, partial [Paragonimus westermani]
MSLLRSLYFCRLGAVFRSQPIRLACSKLSSSPVDEVPPVSKVDDPASSVETEQLALLRTENEKLLSSHAEIEDKYKRALAELENMRKRLMRQIDEAKMFGVQSFCKDLLDVADILTKATESVSSEELKPGVNPPFANLYEGLKLTEQQMLKVSACLLTFQYSEFSSKPKVIVVFSRNCFNVLYGFWTSELVSLQLALRDALRC